MTDNRNGKKFPMIKKRVKQIIVTRENEIQAFFLAADD